MGFTISEGLLANVYRRGDTYWIRYQWRGQEFRRSARTSSKTVAQQFLAQELEEARRLDRGGKPRRSYREALERFSMEYLPTLKLSSQERYRVSLRQLEPLFGSLFLDEITKGRLADFVSARKKAKVTNATIRRDLAAFSCLCTCAVGWDFIEINPVKAFSKRGLREGPPRTSYPSEKEVQRLIDYAPPSAARIIQFLAETGMRQEEVVGLEWSQVNLQRREVRLTKTKTSSPRIVPLSDDALGTLVGTPRHPTSRFVFWHSDGQRYQHFSGIYRSIANRAGVRWRCHDLRHRYASEFIQATGDIAALQAILGHRTIGMTMKYAHVRTEHLHRAVGLAGTKTGTSSTDREGHGHQSRL